MEVRPDASGDLIGLVAVQMRVVAETLPAGHEGRDPPRIRSGGHRRENAVTPSAPSAPRRSGRAGECNGEAASEAAAGFQTAIRAGLAECAGLERWGSFGRFSRGRLGHVTRKPRTMVFPTTVSHAEPGMASCGFQGCLLSGFSRSHPRQPGAMIRAPRSTCQASQHCRWGMTPSRCQSRLSPTTHQHHSYGSI